MIAAQIIGALFGIFAVINLVKGDVPNGLVGLAISAVLIALDHSVRRAREQRYELVRWLGDHEREIRNGGARLGNVLVTPSTRFREMTLCVSVLMASFRIRSAYLVEDRDSIVGTAFGWSVLSLLLGWWGLPWGPIYTLQALASNLRGGKSYDVDALIGARN